MTLQEIAYELRLAMRKQKLFDDDELSDRMLKHWVHNQRALWLRNDLNKNHSIDDQIVQRVCMELEVADRSECPVKTTGVTVLKTVSQLPKVIELHNSDGVIDVSPVDILAYSFSYVPLARARVSGKGRFNSKIIFAFKHDDYIYITSQRNESFARYIRFIMIRGIFEDPTELAEFAHVDGTACYVDTDEYPLNRWMWNYMQSEIIKAKLPLLVEVPTDTINDAQENLELNDAATK